MNKKMKSIKIKILTFLIPMLLIVFIILSGLGYKFASDSLEKSNLNIMAEMTKTAAGRAEDVIKSEIKNLEVIASNPKISDESVPLKDKLEILKPALNATGQVQLSISDKDGNSIDTAGNAKKIKTTQSFIKSIKGENAITNPYVDPITNFKVISYSVPIKDSKGDIIGTITSVKDCRDFSVLEKGINFLNTGSALIVDSNGNFIVAQDETLVSENKNITNMTSDNGSLDDLNNIGKSMIIGTQSGIGKYNYEGKSKYMTYSPIGNTGLSIGITVEEKDLLSALSSLAIVDTVVTIIMILLISFIIVAVTIKLINRLLGAKTYVDSIAKGDFYTPINNKYVKGNDEISEICTSISEAKMSVGGMIKSVRDNANTVKSGSLELNEIAEELSILTEEISASIGEVSNNTNKQSCDFEEITNKLDEFGEKVNVVNDNIYLIKEEVLVINDKSLRGTKDIEELNYSITSIDDSFEKFAKNIDYVEENMKNVNEITGIINGISEQINLLAFNAAIEAASAGEAGRGFNVIALEIRKLSDKSKKSTQSIYRIINTLIKITNNLVEESKNMDSELENQKNIIYKASSSFAEIAVLVNEITPNVANINNAFQDINCNKNLIVSTVYGLSEEIKNTSNSLEQVTYSSIELAKLAEKVNGSSDVLLYKADDLMEKVKQFKIEEEDLNKELVLAPGEFKLPNLNEEEIKTDELSSERLETIKLNGENSEDLNIAEDLDLSLVEKFVDLSVSPLEKIEADLPTKDFGLGCCKVTEFKEYVKEKEIKEYDDDELKNYNILC